MTTRRDFLCTVLGGAAAAAFAAHGDPQDDDLEAARAAKGTKAGRAAKPLRILILGGTGFLGPHLVENARGRGHTLTLFNRGKTHPELFPDLEKLRGDRNGQLDALKGKKWDGVIDTSGYVPRIVKMSAELLAPAVKQYVFISSISVFPDDVKPGANESTPVQPLTEPGSEEVRKHYGALKALCEQAAEAALPGRATNVRPGLIVGPGDPTDRYTYWPARLGRGGEVLAPGDGKDPVQYVDVRDLAGWIVQTIERGQVGVYNATGPEKPLTMAAMLDSCRKAGSRQSNLVWVPEKFLAEQKVSPWDDMPVWTGAEGGFSQIDCTKAIRAGLRFRPADETAKDTLAFWNGLPEERRKKPRAGLTPEREQQLLAAWKTRKS
ncbi:MAG TPA: NAD-dependent epimerase/dehydratase family protein [Myxococcales bacterium]|nr:NAD-dependent epimerase/dehydratase family protein [Myxococcales bacterium]